MVREGGREGGKLLSKLVVETLFAKGVTSLKNFAPAVNTVYQHY